jgi:hypothetical protein
MCLIIDQIAEYKHNSKKNGDALHYKTILRSTSTHTHTHTPTDVNPSTRIRTLTHIHPHAHAHTVTPSSRPPPVSAPSSLHASTSDPGPCGHSLTIVLRCCLRCCPCCRSCSRCARYHCSCFTPPHPIFVLVPDLSLPFFLFSTFLPSHPPPYNRLFHLLPLHRYLLHHHLHLHLYLHLHFLPLPSAPARAPREAR